MQPFSQTFLAFAACFLLMSGAQADLEPRLGGQAVYDTDLDITWLANANLARTNTFGVGGIFAVGAMNWNVANSWITAMNADGGTGYLGFNDWRLPVTIYPDPTCTVDGTGNGGTSAGFGCTRSELGHLFYDELLLCARSFYLSKVVIVSAGSFTACVVIK